MRLLKPLTILLLPLLLLISCSKQLNVNDQWKEIMVVYGLLNPNDSIQYIKITKAYLGPGNALDYASIYDSSNFSHKLQAYLEELDGQTLVKTILLDTTMITDKDSGLFYFPDQLMYYTTEKLNQNHDYKLVVTDTISGIEVSSETGLIHEFAIQKPNAPPARATFEVGRLVPTQWTSAVNGKRYQLLIRFNYWEVEVADPSVKSKHYVDWLIFNDLKSKDLAGGEEMSYEFYGDGFYQNIHNKVAYDPSVTRVPDSVEYIFTVGGNELNNYMDVTDPSNTIVQEKPAYSNIINGIGLFSSRTDNTQFTPRKLRLSDKSLDYLFTGPLTDSLF
jgi:hypothetical protein